MISRHSTLLKALGVIICGDLLTIALTHRSYAYENGSLITNERLEFLGDSVLELVVTEELYHRYPDFSEGDLAKTRANVINTKVLADIGRSLTENGLGSYLLLSKGEECSGGADKSSILADGVESLFGAMYLQYGLTKVREVVLKLFNKLLNTAPNLNMGLDWKSNLRELAYSHSLGEPGYIVTCTGPDHNKKFLATVMISDTEYGRGIGNSKKEAELKAATAACNLIENINNNKIV